MKTFTIDSSVIIKWIFPEHPKEDHTAQALDLLKAIKQKMVKTLQPIHWMAETMAVVARLEPSIAHNTIDLLQAMDLPTIDTPEIYYLACELSKKYQHHLFDTLYHAVALYNGNSQFITADEKYYKKTFKKGAITRLADFSIFEQ